MSDQLEQSGKLLEVRTDDCLNRRHRASQCERCLVCPTAAIHLEEGLPQLDRPRCVECGLCVAACPMDVFRMEGAGDAAILDGAKGWDAMEVACGRRADLETTRAPNVQGAQRLTCLARLSPEVLSALAAEHREVWLDDSLCGACPIGRAHASILNVVKESRELLTSWGKQDRIKLYSESPGLLAANPRVFPVETTPTPRYTRRDFLSLLSLNVGKLAATAVVRSLPDDTRAPFPAAQPRVETLQHALSKLGMPERDGEGARLVTIEVDERCTACGLCARICPTRAIHFEAGSDQYSLTFDVASCLGANCRLCERICIPNALSIRPGVSRASLPVSTPTLRLGALAHCERCHLAYAAVEGQTLCPECREKKDRPIGNRT